MPASWKPAIFAWIPEILSGTLSLCVFAAIVVLLKFYDGQVQPELPGHVTLNVLLQFLVTISQFLFFTPIISGLGQHKWIWFSSGARPISNFQAFEEACRGGFGTIKLLVGLGRGQLLEGLLIRFAALLVISSFITSPITQQVLTYQVMQRPSSNGTALAQHTIALLPSSADDSAIRNYDTQQSTQKALLDGAFFDVGKNISYLAPSCSTADCSWEPYGTIGICVDTINATGKYNTLIQNGIESYITSQFNNLSDKISSRGDQYAPQAVFSFPMPISTGLFGKSVSEAAILETVIAFSNTNHSVSTDSEIQTMIADLQYFGLLFHWCTKTLVGDVVAGLATIEEKESTLNILSPPAGSLNYLWNTNTSTTTNWNQAFCQFDDSTGGLVLQSPLDSVNYTVGSCTGLLTSLIFVTEIEGYILRGTGLDIAIYDGIIVSPVSLALYGDGRRVNITDPDIRFANMKGLANNMARSMTNWLLDNGPRLSDSNSGVSGTVFTAQSIVVVRWSWLALLGCQIVLSAVLLAATIAMTRAYGLKGLKDSSMATICALDPDTRAALGPLNDLSGIKKRVKTTKVRLQRNSSDIPTWLMTEYIDEQGHGVAETKGDGNKNDGPTVQSKLLR
ncbi:hypothetical protein BX600DRAFT_477876 [Xylariales sp. PMI_506]|nr:hypothetical protein BX600DRAFT_477876 [Xylariales sp. PMI_506]